MITAAEALHLDQVKFTDIEKREYLETLKDIEKHIRENFTFAGVPALDIPVRFLSSGNVAKAICVKMAQCKWNVMANLMSTAPRLERGSPIPHHWTFQIAPMIEAYNEADLLPSEASHLSLA